MIQGIQLGKEKPRKLGRRHRRTTYTPGVSTIVTRVISTNINFNQTQSHLARKDGPINPQHHIRDLNPGTLLTINTLQTIPIPKSDTFYRLNNIRTHTKTRDRHNGSLEATEGLGSIPQQQPQETQEKEPGTHWFVPFLDEYEGSNPLFAITHKRTVYHCILDTGAGVNLMGAETAHKMMPDYKKRLTPTTTEARNVSGKKVPLLGKLKINLSFGGQEHKDMIFEITSEGNTLIIGNPFLFDNDVHISVRHGFGTRLTQSQQPSSYKHKTIPIYSTQDIWLDKGGITTSTVRPKLPHREQILDINRPFLTSDHQLDNGATLINSISALTADGTLIATIHNNHGPTAITIKAGTYLGQATTDIEDGEHLVTSVMADLADIQTQINNIPTQDIVGPNVNMDGIDTEILAPGFDIQGPCSGGVRLPNKKPSYDTERENQGDSIEDARIHATTDKARREIRKLLRKHKSMFSTHNYDIGHFAIEGVIQKVKLTLSDTTPIVEKYRTISPAKRQAALEILQQLEKSKIITRKASSFASQAVWVTKALPELTPERAKELNIEFIPGAKDPDGKRNLRFCQDYRQLNTRLQQVQWPLPSVKNVLGRLKDIKYVTVLDASHSFFCIELDEQSKIYTGFQACERHFIMNRLAMGLKCSSGILNACLARTLQGLEEITIPYSDNILIISKTEAEHVTHIDKVLTALRNHGWKFKLPKSHWAVTKILKIFGMIIDLEKGTIRPDPTKTQALRDAPAPTTKKQLRAFLGGIGYFIECLGDIGKPLALLQDLTKNDTHKKVDKIIWTEESREAYKTITAKLGKPNAIYMPDWSQPFHLVVDAGPKHTSSMLVQIQEEKSKWVPLGFFCKKLSEREQKLSQVEKEALAVVYGLRQTSYYVAHTKTFIHSDNKPFVLLKKYSGVNTKLARWKLWLDSFDHELVWDSSTTPAISFADFLSRPPSEKLKNRTITANDVQDMPTNIPDGIYNPAQYNKILEDIINKQDTERNQQAEETLAIAAVMTTPGRNGPPPTRDQEALSQTIASVTTSHRSLHIGTPSRNSATGKQPNSPEDSLIEIIVGDCPYLNLEKLQELQSCCSKLGPIYNNIEKFPEYLIHNGLLLRRFSYGEINRLLMTVPVCLADDLISDIHKGSRSTHSGKAKLIKMIRSRYFVPELRQRVSKIVDNCGICSFYKPKAGPKQGPRPDSKKIKANGPGDLWSMDHIQIVSRPDSEGRTSLLCFVDVYSHFLIYKAVPKTITARYAATCFLEEVIARFGIPRALLSDNGSDMDCTLWRETANLLNIKKITISAGSARSNGICEKVQGLVLAAIKYQAAQFRVKPDDFADLAIWAALAHNATPYQDLEPPLSPAEIFLGRSIAESSFFGFANAAYSYANLEDFNLKMIAAQATISEIVGSRERYLSELKSKTQTNTASQWNFPKGTLVALRDKSQATQAANIKLRPRYRGAFIVVDQTHTSCLIRPYSSETILEDMEDESVAIRGRGRPLPR